MSTIRVRYVVHLVVRNSCASENAHWLSLHASSSVSLPFSWIPTTIQSESGHDLIGVGVRSDCRRQRRDRWHRQNSKILAEHEVRPDCHRISAAIRSDSVPDWIAIAFRSESGEIASATPGCVVAVSDSDCNPATIGRRRHSLGFRDWLYCYPSSTSKKYRLSLGCSGAHELYTVRCAA